MQALLRLMAINYGLPVPPMRRNRPGKSTRRIVTMAEEWKEAPFIFVALVWGAVGGIFWYLLYLAYKTVFG